MNISDIRIGFGTDVHAFAKGRRLIIGGVEINHPTGLAGHSDADVLIHALCDAILGAVGFGDIGEHFPDSDPQYKDISSLFLLKACLNLLSEKGYEILNIDSIIYAQTPRLTPHKQSMKNNIALILGINPDRINIKATTTENLGFIGRKEGIAAQCTILTKKIDGR